MRERREWLKAHHFCIRCKEQDAYTIAGRVLCAECAAKKPEYDCSCYEKYPNEARKMKNGKWMCVDKYEPVEVENVRPYHLPMTHCRRKNRHGV